MYVSLRDLRFTMYFVELCVLRTQDVVYMAKTLEKIFEQKLQAMPAEECEVDPHQKGRKKPPRKQKGM
jgi:hypothetical protein